MASGFNGGDFVVGLGITGAILGFLVYVIDKTKSTLAVTGNATTNPGGANVNSTFDNTITAMKDATDWFAILVVAGMGTIAIGLLMGGLGKNA